MFNNTETLETLGAPVPLNNLENGYIPRNRPISTRIYHKYKWDNIGRCLILISLLMLIGFQLIQFWFALQVVNSSLWTEIKKVNIGFYRHQIESLINHLNKTLTQIDHINISNYENQVHTLMINANQTLVQVNNLVAQIKFFFPANHLI